MYNKCRNCKLLNHNTVNICTWCGYSIRETVNIPSNRGFHNSGHLKRALIFVAAFAIALAGFYVSLLLSAARLSAAEHTKVAQTLHLLEEKGFADEVFFLKHLASFRSNDNWLNASVEKENPYAATNFPFEIVTLYPDFFSATTDDTERAAILLHEAKHLQGSDEQQAYEFVWKNRGRLGWIKARYGNSQVWLDVRKQTREYLPSLFACEWNEYLDCTENTAREL
ncbi:MAG: hypothetical protein ABI539_12090 [Acidobacteriota bacterium]